jgi:hypothetical protein
MTTKTKALESSARPPADREGPAVSHAAAGPDPADSCAVCPLRSTAEDSTLDYCEGCTAIERKCPSCLEFRPQSGWWWGADRFGLHGVWVCGSCRLPYPSAEWAARYPEIAASHPEHARIMSEHARFVAAVEVPNDEVRFLAATALSRAASLAGPGAAAAAVAAMATAVGAGGKVDVDVSAVSLSARRAVERLLHDAAWGKDAPQRASQPLSRLLRSWSDWLAQQLPKPAQQATQADQKARDRAALRGGRERKVVG